jgi:hypothetical protein
MNSCSTSVATAGFGFGLCERWQPLSAMAPASSEIRIFFMKVYATILQET